MPQFGPPVVRLDQDTSLRQPVYVPARTARPRAHRLGWRRRAEDGEGSSTESQADLQRVPAELSGYVDHLVDAQYPEYVVIEASPRETGEEVHFLFHTLALIILSLCDRFFLPHLPFLHQQSLYLPPFICILLATTSPSPVPCSLML